MPSLLCHVHPLQKHVALIRGLAIRMLSISHTSSEPYRFSPHIGNGRLYLTLLVYKVRYAFNALASYSVKFQSVGFVQLNRMEKKPRARFDVTTGTFFIGCWLQPAATAKS